MTLVAPESPPLAACRVYSEQKLTARGYDLPVDATPPDGEPTAYVLLSQLGTVPRGPVTDYLLRARLFNADPWACIQQAQYLHAALLGAAQHRIVIPDVGALWVTGTSHQMGPADLDDPDVPLFGQQMAVFWTVALKPIEGETP